MESNNACCLVVPKAWVRGLAIGVGVSVVVVASLLLFASRRSDHASQAEISRGKAQLPRPPDVEPRCQCTPGPNPKEAVNISDTAGKDGPSPGGESSMKFSGVLKYAQYASRLFSNPETSFAEEKFTIVILTYKRTGILQKDLNHYCQTPKLDKILVIWNDVETPVPDFLLSLSNSCAVPLKFIKETENKLTNRFKPRTEIETDCVAFIDDDRFITELSDLTFGFGVWQQFRQRIVGFEHRMHSKLSDGTFHYGSDPHQKEYPGYSMMITTTAILHRVYLEMYFDKEVLPKGMIEYIDRIKNCEDIGMNVMVTNFLGEVSWPQSSALSVAPHGSIENMEAQSHGSFRGLSMRTQHYAQRPTQVERAVGDLFLDRIRRESDHAILRLTNCEGVPYLDPCKGVVYLERSCRFQSTQEKHMDVLTTPTWLPSCMVPCCG